eukprot:4738595-Pyramimonas_sp.AAC.1
MSLRDPTNSIKSGRASGIGRPVGPGGSLPLDRADPSVDVEDHPRSTRCPHRPMTEWARARSLHARGVYPSHRRPRSSRPFAPPGAFVACRGDASPRGSRPPDGRDRPRSGHNPDGPRSGHNPDGPRSGHNRPWSQTAHWGPSWGECACFYPPAAGVPVLAVVAAAADVAATAADVATAAAGSTGTARTVVGEAKTAAVAN